jgi:transposase
MRASDEPCHYRRFRCCGGHRAAAVYTLIETCKMNDVDPLVWLADVLARLPDQPANKVADLLPWNWKVNHQSRKLS